MERFGILGHRPHGPNGEHLLVLWNGDHAFVEPGTPHAEICARHGLDRVEPGSRIRVCTAVCVDGPLAGKTNP